jgi:hypothetical protein
MEHLTNSGKEPERSTFSWLELTTGFWKEISKIINDAQPSLDETQIYTSETDSFKEKFRTYNAWKTGLKNLNAFIQTISQPDNQKTASKSMVTFFEFLTQITGDSSENLLEFQSQVLNSISKIGEHTKAYNFDDIDQHIFESFRKLYENEFKKYLFTPKLGLPRFHIERISILIDKFNIFYSFLNELTYLFFAPLEKTNHIMLSRIDEIMKQNNFVEDPETFYSEWIKMLEGHYMTLLQSAEYMNTLKKAIDSLADYRKAKEEVICLLLKELPIPTNREMDDVYKELYMVKKQLRELSNQMSRLNNR